MMVVVHIVKGMKHNGLAFAEIEVLAMVVYHKIGVDDTFIAAKDNVAPADKRKVLLQPFILFR
jgi:hypothetical protein